MQGSPTLSRHYGLLASPPSPCNQGPGKIAWNEKLVDSQLNLSDKIHVGVSKMVIPKMDGL